MKAFVAGNYGAYKKLLLAYKLFCPVRASLDVMGAGWVLDNFEDELFNWCSLGGQHHQHHLLYLTLLQHWPQGGNTLTDV